MNSFNYAWTFEILKIYIKMHINILVLIFLKQQVSFNGLNKYHLKVDLSYYKKFNLICLKAKI